MLLIYTSNITNRFSYIVDFLCGDILGIDYQITSDLEAFKKSKNDKLVYANQKINDYPFIRSHSLLFEDDIKKQEIIVSEWDGLKIFFQSDRDSFIPFDIFAASFWLLTRYEEHLPYEEDGHGRFKASESLAYQKNFLHIPIIDMWAYQFAGKINSIYPDISIKKRVFQFIPTIDVDNAYAYLHKGTMRVVGAFLRSLFKMDIRDNIKRVRVLAGRKKDPYNTYHFIDEVHKNFNLHHIYFFLVGKYGKFDKNISLKKKAFRDLITREAEQSEIGIHPSYASNKDFNVLQDELKKINSITGGNINKSRQHFLKIKLPDTYDNLVKAGIKEDYSMGFHDIPGFRAGTCTPFYLYGLKEEKKMDILLYPFQIMDLTLKKYATKNYKEAFQDIRGIIDAVNKVGGTFVSLWHNESFRNDVFYNESKEFYLKMLNYIFSMDDEKKYFIL